MKAIKIDVATRSIYEVEVGDYKTYYQHISPNCGTFSVPLCLSDNSGIFVDDEGMYNGTAELGGFIIEGEDGSLWPLLGNGLIVGCDDDGDACDANLQLVQRELSGKLYWIAPEKAMAYAESCL